jgi:hypothetical protein
VHFHYSLPISIAHCPIIPTAPSHFQAAFDHGREAVETMGRAWLTAQKPGELRNRLLTVARTWVGLLALSTYPSTAISVATLCAIYPPVGSMLAKMIDDMMNGLLSGLPSWARYFQPIMALFVFFVPNMPFLSFVGHLVAAKLAMELASKNYNKELRLASSELHYE